MTIASTLRHASMLAAGLLLLGGCGDDSPPKTASGASAVASPVAPSTAWAPPPGDPYGVRACDAIRKINATNAIDPDLDAELAAANDGVTSTNPGIAAVAAELQAAVKARKAAGANADLSVTLAVGTAGLKLETTCLRSGYVRFGS